MRQKLPASVLAKNIRANNKRQKKKLIKKNPLWLKEYHKNYYLTVLKPKAKIRQDKLKATKSQKGKDIVPFE